MDIINIGEMFSDTIVNRNSLQGDGTSNGEEFRNKFLKELEDDNWWHQNKSIILNFQNVDTLGPSWANEVFAYYTKNRNPQSILKHIILENITSVKKRIIETEIEAGYRGYK